jgi:hypothetical protein
MEIDKINSKKKTQPHGQCQDKISERVTFSKQEKDAELPYYLLPKHTCQAMIINTFSLDEKSSAAFKLVVVSITSKYSNDSFKVSEGERFAPNFFRLGDFNSSQLIVMYSKYPSTSAKIAEYFVREYRKSSSTQSTETTFHCWPSA